MIENLKATQNASDMTRQEALEMYKEHMRQAMHHQQEAYFCLIKVLSPLRDDDGHAR